MSFLRTLRSVKWLSNTSLPTALLIGALLTTGSVGCMAAVDEQQRAQRPSESTVQPPVPEREQAAPVSKPAQQPVPEEQAFKIEDLLVQEEQAQTTLRIKFSQPVTQYRHFPLLQPSRIVLDVFGEVKQAAPAENFRADTNWVGTVRLSSGDGYLRLVMDIAAATVPQYEIEPQNGDLKVVIGQLNPGATAKKNLQLIQGGKRTDVRVAEAKPSGAAQTAVSDAAPQRAAPGEKKYTGQRISLDFKDADIKNVFRLLAEVSGLNIVVTGDVQKRVTLRLVDVPWDQALDLLIDTNGLGKEQIGNIVRISTAGQLKAEKDALKAAQEAEEKLDPLHTAYLNVNYAKVKDLVDKIKLVLSPRGVIVPDERSNTILVRDIRSGIEEANAVVGRLDTRTPQVLIESNLIETTPTFSRALGAELDFLAPIRGDPGRFTVLTSRNLAGSPFAGAPEPEVPPVPIPTSGMRFGIFQNRVGAIRNLNAFLTTAEEEGKIKIISRPSVVTLNNIASTIQSLRVLRVTLPSSTNVATGTGAAAGAAIATEKIPVGIILTVTPQVSSDGFVLMNISVKSSTLGTQSPGSAVPDELTREALSNVLVRDGETIIIGGIMKDTSQESEVGVPYLKDIPVLGWLFKRIRWQKDFEELVVFITPRIVAGGSENLPTAEQLWREQLKKTEGE